MNIDELVEKYTAMIENMGEPKTAIEAAGKIAVMAALVVIIFDLQALKAESKPSWDDAPEWANSMRQGRGKPWEWHGFLKYRPVDELPTAAEDE